MDFDEIDQSLSHGTFIFATYYVRQYVVECALRHMYLSQRRRPLVLHTFSIKLLLVLRWFVLRWITELKTETC